MSQLLHTDNEESFSVAGYPHDLIWHYDLEIGELALKDSDLTEIYDDSYFDCYIEYSSLDTSNEITQFRYDFLTQYAGKGYDVCDVGVGAGVFVNKMGCKGFDVMPKAVEMLKQQGQWFDIENNSIDVATFWDSLEHIENPAKILSNVKNYAFVSCPIYSNYPYAVMQSKHFKPNEHVWYWTETGLINFMGQYGFQMIGYSDREQKICREGVMTYAFMRTKPTY